MVTQLLERGSQAELLTDGGGTPPEKPPLTAAPAENPNGDHRTQADYDKTFTGIAEQYGVDVTLGEIAENEGVAGPGVTPETSQEVGNAALKGIDVNAAFAEITGTPDMQNVDTKAESDTRKWNNPTDTGATYEQSEDLSDVNAVGNTIIEEHKIAQADGWKPELSVVENPQDDGDDTPHLSLVPKQ